jgi:hypothetical protein
VIVPGTDWYEREIPDLFRIEASLSHGGSGHLDWIGFAASWALIRVQAAFAEYVGSKTERCADGKHVSSVRSIARFITSAMT